MNQDRQKDKKRAVQEAHQSDDEPWKGSNDEINRAIDTVLIKSFNLNKTTMLEYKVDTGSNGILMPVNMLNVLFP